MNVVFLAIFSLHIWRRAYTPDGITRNHNIGPKYRNVSCIYDILNRFADTQPAYRNAHVLYVASYTNNTVECAKL